MYQLHLLVFSEINSEVLYFKLDTGAHMEASVHVHNWETGFRSLPQKEGRP
jgi:hypothetical protein